MERQRKERLVGAAVILMLAVIFIPMVLDDSVQPEGGISATNIPPQPEDAFSSRIVPLAADTPGIAAPAPAPAGAATSPAPAPAGTTPAPDMTSPAVPPATPAPAPGEPAVAAGGAAPVAAPTAGADVGVTAWVVQLGSFASEENANTLNRKLRQAGFSSFVEPLQQGGAKVFRVRVGPELRRTAAQSVRDRLKSGMDLDGIVVPYP